MASNENSSKTNTVGLLDKGPIEDRLARCEQLLEANPKNVRVRLLSGHLYLLDENYAK
jgi:hypothetical protein